MALVRGTDNPDNFGRLEGFAVLGTCAGSPSTTKDEDGRAVTVNTVGVYGAVGDADAVSELVDNIPPNFGQKVTAGVAGAFVPKKPKGAPADTDAFGLLGGNDFSFFQPTGVYGESSHQGVFGISKGSVGSGVVGLGAQKGSNFDPDTGGKGVFGSAYVGVIGHTQTGVAVLGKSFSGGKAGKFEGDVEITGKIAVDRDVDVRGNSFFAGDVEVTGDIRLVSGQDLAEEFDIRETAGVEPGSVMVFDSDAKLHPCRQPYDKKVAGVIAGAGTCKPAIVLGKLPSVQRRLPIALVGTAYCKVDAEYGAVEVGDPLTASPTPGHAMKATDPSKAFGAIIGKALRSLDSGQSLIPILIAMQ